VTSVAEVVKKGAEVGNREPEAANTTAGAERVAVGKS